MDSDADRNLRHQRFFEGAALGFCLLDEALCILEVNPAWERLLEFTNAELIGNPIWNYVHPDDVPATRLMIDRLRATQTTKGLDNRFRTKSGHYRWFRWDYAFDVETNWSLGIGKDITAERKVQKRLEVQYALTTVLADATTMETVAGDVLELLRDHLDVDLAGLWIRDVTSNLLRLVQIKHLSSTDLEVFVGGIKEATFAKGIEIPGRAWETSKPLWIPELKQETSEARHRNFEPAKLNSALAVPIIGGGTVRGVLEFLSQEFSAPDPDDLDLLTHVCSQIGQFMERKSVEDKLVQSQKMEALGRLAGGVAHDFNNLLTIIIGHTDLLRARSTPANINHEAYMEIAEAARRASELTQQLLAYGRRQVLHPRLMDLNAAIEEALPLLKRLVGPPHQIELRLAPDISTIMADPGSIQQVLMNLAVNARDAMPGGGVLTLETRCLTGTPSEDGPLRRKPPTYDVVLKVADTGVGIGPEIKAHLFEPFFTTKELGKGTGLGLSTVQGIVAQSGGSISVESAPGHGTHFQVVFPGVWRPDSLNARGEMFPPVEFGAQVGNETILIVEDEAPLRRLGKSILQNAGYRVLDAENGAAALEICKNHPEPISLIVMDMVMPGATGLDTANCLMGNAQHAKVLFVSGYSGTHILEGHDLRPGRAFLQKPFTSAALLTNIRTLLDAGG